MQVASRELIRLAKAPSPVGVISAIEALNFEIPNELTRLADMPWNQIRGIHLDKYVNLSVNTPFSFRRYLHEQLTSTVRMKEFLERAFIMATACWTRDRSTNPFLP